METAILNDDNLKKLSEWLEKEGGEAELNEFTKNDLKRIDAYLKVRNMSVVESEQLKVPYSIR